MEDWIELTKERTDSDYGNGHFGQWVIDPFNLPCYEYTCFQTLDPLARTNTSGKDSTDHWHQVGNDRITLTAHNGGYMQFFIADRGLQWLSFHNSKKGQLAGGICFIEENKSIWADLYSSKLKDAQPPYRRLFGCGYFQKNIEKNGIALEHFIYPPFGDDPVVLSEITVTNHSKEPKTISAYEFWGIDIHSLIGSMLSMLYMTEDRKKFGDSRLVSTVLRAVKRLLLGIRLGSEQIRERFGSKFQLKTRFSHSERCLIMTPVYIKKKPVKRGAQADRNYFLDPIFLASFEDKAPIRYYNSSSIVRKDNSYSMQRSFSAETPPNACLMLGHEITLKPQERKTLKFIFGTAEEEQIRFLIKKYETLVKNDFKADNFRSWAEELFHFSSKSEQWLSREVLWHSYYLRSAALFDDYFASHYLPQGNAYTFLHGANGAIRDYILFTIPMIYQNPALAREMLEYIFRTMTPDGELPYAIVGVGQEMGAMVHETSSDLHLFLLWGLLEYLYMTRDFDFLEKNLPFYPLESAKSSTVLDRIPISLNFLFKKVGIGEHGLIKVGSGDWSDGISLLVKSRRKFLKKGESTFNSAFALYVIPRLIELLEECIPQLVPFLRKQYESISFACLKAWNGHWFYRAWEDTDTPVGDTNLFLEHHPWLLLSGVVPEKQAEVLINNIHKILDLPSRTGQYILYPPRNVLLNILPRGWDVNGGIWHAMNFLLTWAYSRYSPDKAYQSLLKNTMGTRAEVYPNIWYGIWSGSDSYNTEYAPNPGQTFIHPATPQTDFPIMNLNLHACILASIIKLVGINPTKKGLTIDPRLPQKIFEFRTPTIAFNLAETELKGFYKPVKEDICEIRVRKPSHWTDDITAFINGEPAGENFTVEKEWLIIKYRVPISGLQFAFKCK